MTESFLRPPTFTLAPLRATLMSRRSVSINGRTISPLGGFAAPSSGVVLGPSSSQGSSGRPDPGKNLDMGQRRLRDGRGSPAGTADCAHKDRAVVGWPCERQ